MKRWFGFFLLPLLLIAVLSGSAKPERAKCRYVTQIDVDCQVDGQLQHIRYTDQEKMRAVLLYLRLLRTEKVPTDAPEIRDADVFEITVSLSNGAQRKYIQKDHSYFRKGNDTWQYIQPQQAAELKRLLFFFESDFGG